MSKLDGRTITLSQLFSQEFFFKIPEYQRPFMWDEDNLSDLIEDLQDASRESEYFLGTLVMHAKPGNNYDIVDGQQRLTALCILLACLRDAEPLSQDPGFAKSIHDKIVQAANPLDGVPERNRLEVRPQGIYNKLISKMGGTRLSGEVQIAGPTEERYVLAVTIFHKHIDKMSLPELRELATHISTKCVFIYLATENFDDAFRLFTVVNDRGKPLRRIDILKAQNLDPEVLPSEVSRSRYAHEWEAMEETLGEDVFEDVFHMLRLIYTRDKPQADLLKEFDSRILGKTKGLARGKEFIDVLDEYVDLYEHVFLACDYLDDKPIVNQFKSLIKIMDNEFKASEWKACLLSFGKKFGPEKFYDYMLEIEKVYLEHWVRGIRKDERYSTYTALLKAIDDAADADAAIGAVKYDATEIEEACRVPNFYGVGYGKYLLLRAEILTSEMDHPRTFTVRSVEHVLPQNPAASSQWRQEFSPADIQEVVNTVGNLVLLSRAKNSAASNREFAAKKTSYLKTRVSDFPRSVQVLGFDDWTKDRIQARTEEFATMILNRP